MSTLKTNRLVAETAAVRENGARAMQSKVRREMIEGSGRIFQLLGLPRSTGQIYGLLYLSERPLSLDDMVALLGLSKGSASLATRHLASWKAIRQVWVPGDRRDYFEAIGDLADVVRAGFSGFIKPRLVSSQKRVAEMMLDMEEDEKVGYLTPQERRFCESRLRVLAKMQKKMLSLAPFAEKLI